MSLDLSNETKLLKATVEKIRLTNSPVSGLVLYELDVSFNLDIDIPKAYTIKFSPGLDWMMNNKPNPVEHLSVHLESQIRDELLKTGKDCGLKIEGL